MTIEDPRINVALTTNNGCTSLLIRRSDADDATPNEPLRWVRWQLGDIEHEGYIAECQRIGTVVLGLLAARACSPRRTQRYWHSTRCCSHRHRNRTTCNTSSFR